LAEASSEIDVKFAQTSSTYWPRIKKMKQNYCENSFMLFFLHSELEEKKMQLRSTGRQPATEVLLQVMCSKK
jgi:hypothetical protein